MDFLHCFRRKDAEAAWSTSLGAVDAVDQKGFTLHASECKRRVSKFIVAAAIKSRSEERQIEGITRCERQVLHRLGVQRAANVRISDGQNRRISLDRDVFVDGYELHGQVQV